MPRSSATDESPEVAYQGVPGAIGQEACRRFLPGHAAVARASFAAVARAVRLGEVDLGMLPLLNSTVGPVPGVAELIAAAGLRIRSRHRLPVRLHLMARPDVALDEVAIVTSHPMALAQCQASIARLGLAAEAAGNTAMAARSVADPSAGPRAAIAAEPAAAAYGLVILVRDVHDRPDNATTFGVVERGPI